MMSELIMAAVAIVSAPLTAALGAFLMKRKYTVEIDHLKAELDRKLTEVRSVELDNVRQGNDILMNQIVEPLRTEIKSLRTDVQKFRRAIEKIPVCHYSVDCPVSRELYAGEKSEQERAARQK